MGLVTGPRVAGGWRRISPVRFRSSGPRWRFLGKDSKAFICEGEGDAVKERVDGDCHCQYQIVSLQINESNPNPSQFTGFNISISTPGFTCPSSCMFIDGFYSSLGCAMPNMPCLNNFTGTSFPTAWQDFSCDVPEYAYFDVYSYPSWAQASCMNAVKMEDFTIKYKIRCLEQTTHPDCPSAPPPGETFGQSWVESPEIELAGPDYPHNRVYLNGCGCTPVLR